MRIWHVLVVFAQPIRDRREIQSFPDERAAQQAFDRACLDYGAAESQRGAPDERFATNGDDLDIHLFSGEHLIVPDKRGAASSALAGESLRRGGWDYDYQSHLLCRFIEQHGLSNDLPAFLSAAKDPET